MFSHAGHVTTETVFRQTLDLWLGNRDEHRALESDMTGLNVKGNLYLYLTLRTEDRGLYNSTLKIFEGLSYRRGART